ncbi:restriction endonuclease subunit S [Lysobacter sp. A6]|uniref:Restriction endonuclease subunit S n=1 Tax=Noviluteimonas lactosilytica TaxID=2888523 RepID=A0ABS8JGE3_9GAMM|nr:restriction endonuclease subunit S [Lysobacter lactosilyticus]MCC8362627.1 restriction endonuclease subunit S [Lysobacter lactosilyticus]
MREVPSGWESAKLKDVVELRTGPFGSSLHQHDYVDGGIPIVNPMHIENGRINPSQKHRVSQETAERLNEFRLDFGDVVLGRRGEMGRCAVVQATQVGWLCGTGSLIVRPRQGIASDFLQGLLSSDAVVKHLTAEAVGTTMVNLNQRILLDLDVLIPPCKEQARIIEKLEELLSDLDAGVAELKAAQRKLAQYRQSLLKAAVEGALTADWRAAPGKPQETGADLLQRILRERRARWEQKQLAKFAEQGTAPPKGWRAKYSEPVAPDLADLPPLPDGWTWASLDQLAEIQGGIQKQPSRAPVANRYPFLRVANVARGHLKLDEIHEIELFEGELERLALQKGDILVVEGNGSLTEIGRCALWDGSIENAVHQNHLIRARPVLVKGEFIEAWLNSLRGIQRMTALAATTSGLYTLSVGKISKIPVPLPPLSEQDVAMESLAATLAESRGQVAATERSLKQAAAQRKNLLKAAFAGQLVPQDLDEEPASELLARIRAERASNNGSTQRRRRKTS